MADLVIFALEGVLADSERIAAEARAQSLAGAGLPVSAEELMEDFGGIGFKEILLKLEESAEVPLQASLLTEAAARVERRLRRELQPVEGAREALGRTPLRCVVSDAPGETMEAMLAKTALKPFVPKAAFSAAALGLKPKPAPDLLLHAAEAMGMDADACFVVEASPAGIRAARAAGMRAIGFSGGAQGYPGLADRLTEAGAETVMRRLGELRGVLAALGEWSALES